MKQKKIAGIGGALAAVAVAAIVAINGGGSIKGGYEIKEINPYKSEVHFDMPEKFTPDIITLYLNDMEIAKTILPDGFISTYPLVVSEPSALTAEMYIRGEKVATGKFRDGGVLDIEMNEELAKEAEGTEHEQ